MTETPPPRRALATFLRRPAREGQPREEAAAAEGSQVPAEGVAPATTAGEQTTPPADPGAEPSLTAPATTAPVAADLIDAEPATQPTPMQAEAAPAAESADALAASAPAAPSAEADLVDADDPAAKPPVDWHAAALPIAPATAAHAAPTFAQPRVRARTPRASAWQWILLAALALLLALQILLADRASFASDARWRPLLSTLCGALHCDLPVWHEPTAFTMLDRDVRPAPGETGVLRIQASFRNDARWDQAWPWLQLSLSDADGRVIGSRVFAPAEYLGHAPDPTQTLAPGQSGRIDFRVREPAAGTAAFTFDFH